MSAPNHAPLDVIVVGAGIGGLAATVALRAIGANVEIHEQARTLARVGAGLQLAPNATATLRGLGLLDRVRPTRFGRPPGAASMPSTAPSTCRSRSETTSSVSTDLPTCTCTRAICTGADGVHSMVRESLFGATEATFSGLVAYRGVAPRDRVAAVPPIAAKWCGGDRHLVHYWVSAGRELNFVAAVPEPSWSEESWAAEGRTADLLEALEGFVEPARHVAGAASTLMRSALYDRDPLPVWGEGRVTLLGDACHPMLPFMAQGAGMALEDAAFLARCLDGITTDGVKDALTRYAKARIPRTSAVQGGSRANGFLRKTNSGLSTEAVYRYDPWQADLPG